jgi:hypothetical protein
MSKTGPMIAVGLLSLGFEGKTRQSGQHRLEQTEGGTKQHKGWSAAGTHEVPSRGTDILKLCI